MHCTKLAFIFLFVALGLSITGCRWNDDFRDRVQPQQFEQAVRPTFNKDSDDYVGDEIAKGELPQHHQEEIPSIDELSEIPEIPHPEPM